MRAALGPVPARDGRAIALAGWALVVAALAFSAVFSWLADAFDYPAVLDGAAATVLPALRATGRTGRAVWTLYGMLPLLLLPVAVGARALLDDASPALGRTAALLAGVAAITMLVGLMRWPTLHWALATAWPQAGPEGRLALTALFDGANTYLGNVLGEFVGELALNGVFLCVAIGTRHDARLPRWSVAAGVLAATLGLVGMWRNVTPLVAPVAEIENAVLPLWMLVLGALLVRAARR